MAFFRKKDSSNSQAMASYTVFSEKKEELREYIECQLLVWGSWDNIPDCTKAFIDREFVMLGRFGKRINVNSIERLLENNAT